MAHALWTDARANRVEARLGRRHRDFRTQPWLTRDGSDLNGARLDLRYLSLEKAVDEGASGPRDAYLRLPRVVLRLEDDDQRWAARMQLLSRDLLLRWHHAFDASKVDEHRPRLLAIDDPAGQLASVLRHIAEETGDLVVGKPGKSAGDSPKDLLPLTKITRTFIDPAPTPATE